MLIMSLVSVWVYLCVLIFFFFKQKTAYEMRISDWSSDVCSSDLQSGNPHRPPAAAHRILTVFVVIPMRRSGYHSASIMSLLAIRRNGPKITCHIKSSSGDEGH